MTLATRAVNPSHDRSILDSFFLILFFNIYILFPIFQLKKISFNYYWHVYTVIPPIVNHVFTRIRLAQSKIIILKKFFQIIKI